MITQINFLEINLERKPILPIYKGAQIPKNIRVFFVKLHILTKSTLQMKNFTMILVLDGYMDILDFLRTETGKIEYIPTESIIHLR